MLLEVCVDSVESAIAAEQGGAKRVELCADLIEGGITPSAGLIATVRRNISIGLNVMIRPRGGDFCYSGLEFEVMVEEIQQARGLGANGIVLGLLRVDGHIDIDRTRKLVDLASPLPVTFHRAIDMTPDLDAALEDVIQTGAARILTSGGVPTVPEAIDVITRLVEAAGKRIVIMPGSGLRAENIAAIARATNAQEFHGSARTAFSSPMQFRKPGMAMGDVQDREYSRYVVQPDTVRSIVKALDSAREPLAAGR